ncbi:hypothetical protein, variant [Plasmodium falciparum MaliPS096_E11]|nr:hypothetical protein, variant [Plasmodium falciparum MaliPS096_E11]
MAKVIRDKRNNKTKGYGFVSLSDPQDMLDALKTMNNKFIGNRPITVKRSRWKDREMNSQKNKDFDNFLKNSQLPTKKFRKFKKIVNNNAKAKIPFPLTYKFKSTLQMGMDIELLDMKFVSSLSWYVYFLVMFGSSGLISIIDYFVLQDKDRSQNNAMDNLMATHNPLAKPPGNMNNIPDLRKFFNKKKEELDNVKYEFLLENIECELLQKWE